MWLRISKEEQSNKEASVRRNNIAAVAAPLQDASAALDLDHGKQQRENLGDDFWKALSVFLFSNFPSQKAEQLLNTYRSSYVKDMIRLSLDDVEEIAESILENGDS